MEKELISKEFPANVSKAAQGAGHRAAAGPLPGRKPSKAFLAALDAVGRMGGSRKKSD